jgi:hypothetical protein
MGISNLFFNNKAVYNSHEVHEFSLKQNTVRLSLPAVDRLVELIET